ncbi:MAG: thioredoxin domain-containing protein [Syntrophobacteraceae bacterium]
MPNRLAEEKSPYLLQHANNPVDWYPWGDAAFKKAAGEDKPIFLSIGYATCHWCHVMEHESFEDEQVAALLNENFVSIKVDREERPDIDQVYMTVCQATTGSGGWPLSIFMGPDKRPFFAGSYFPKTGRHGMPGFMDILRQLALLWTERRGQLDRIREEITTAIQPKPSEGSPAALGPEVLENAYSQLRKSYDPEWGGFGGAPKFPTPHNLNLLLRWHLRNPQSGALAMVRKTLEAMRAGGIFDQVGFGFHRYSVDEKWLVPHFEKMLYDQALLSLAYTEAAASTGNDQFARVAGEIFEYVLRDMRSPEGGFYSAEDADSEGKEGTFYVWTPREVAEVLGASDADLFCRAYGITARGNFEDGKSIPNIAKPLGELAATLGLEQQSLDSQLEQSRRKLFEAREKRIHPLKDDKILTSWNGLMIAALSRGYQAFGNESYASAARNAADFILGTLQPGGRLHRRYRQGEVVNPAYADDYAFLIWGLLDLYESVFEPRYLDAAIRLQEQMITLFEDASAGGFFFTGEDSESMIVREKPLYDGAIPSGNSVAALNLLRLGRMSGNTAFEQKADRLMKCFSAQVVVFPPAYTSFLQAVDFSSRPARDIVIAGDISGNSVKEMIEAVHRAFVPGRVLLVKDIGERGAALSRIAPFTEAMIARESGAAAYICEGFKCREPVHDLSEFKLLVRG